MDRLEDQYSRVKDLRDGEEPLEGGTETGRATSDGGQEGKGQRSLIGRRFDHKFWTGGRTSSEIQHKVRHNGGGQDGGLVGLGLLPGHDEGGHGGVEVLEEECQVFERAAHKEEGGGDGGPAQDVLLGRGGHMAGGARIEDSGVFNNSVFQINLSSEEVSKSLTFRELRGIEEGLKALRSEVSGGAVRWHCDNWGACKIVEYGSTKKDCHKVAVRIKELIDVYKVDFDFGDCGSCRTFNVVMLCS